MSRIQQIRILVDALCDYGFMNGWMGDTSEEFREEQTQMLNTCSQKDFDYWLDNNSFNLTTYCGINPIVVSVK